MSAHNISETALSRRALFAGFGAGSLVLAVELSASPLVALVNERTALTFDPSLFLSIAEDGTVTIVAHRSEMGTGIRTALPMVVADELGADWDRVKIEQAPGDPRLGSQNTDGSQSIREGFSRMLAIGATARTMLERAAAARWGVDPAECRGANHKVSHVQSKRSIDYGDLVADALQLEVPAGKDLIFKPASQRTYIGKNVEITDMDVILNGKSVYGLDARMEGQLFAVIARSPVLGAAPESFDSAAAKAIPGVVSVIEIPTFSAEPAYKAMGGIAVLATNTWAAIRGREALAIKWGASPNSKFTSADFEESLAESARSASKVWRDHGDVDEVFGKTAKANLITSEYYAPLLAHASMEPPSAVASVEVDDGGKAVRCEVLAATQDPQACQGSVAAALGMPAEDVHVNVTLLGGGFGRKSKPDYVVEAALLSRASGKPVHVTWTREDDIRHDYYHAVSAMRMQAAVDDKGVPLALSFKSAFTPIGSTFTAGDRDGGAEEMGMGATGMPFGIPNVRVENGPASAHVRIGWLRSVAHVYHAFAVCSFADELAQRAGRDSYEYLMEVLLVEQEGTAKALAGTSIERLRDVTARAAKMAKWGRKLPPGRGLGIASHFSFGSYCASVVEVEVSKLGKVKIPKVWMVCDAGTIVHPDRVHAQMEGAAVFGSSLTMYGEITAKDGVIEQGNFDDYKVSRMIDAPLEIEVELVPSDGPPGGVGEPGVPPFAPAMCNAIFAATGKRVRRLPLSKHDLSW